MTLTAADFFFFVGFSIQLLILVDSLSSGEKGVTIAAVPVSILVIALAAWGVRREIHILMALFFLCWAGALVRSRPLCHSREGTLIGGS